MPDRLLSAVSLLADEFWAFHCDTAQLWNIDRGEVDYVDRWEDLSADGVRARIDRLGDFAQRADALAGSVDGDERTLAAAVSFGASSTASLLPYMRDLALVAGPMNIVAVMTTLVPSYGLTTEQHGRGYVDKLRSTGSFIDGWIDGVRDGLTVGRVASARGVQRTIDELDRLLAVRVEDDALIGQVPPSELSELAAEVWRGDVVEAVRGQVRPALTELRAFLQDELLPGARSDDRSGICHVPNGDADYQLLLHAATSIRISAEEVHRIGRERLELLDDEYAALGTAVFGIDDPAGVRARLRDDPALPYQSGEEIMTDAVATLDRAAAEAPHWFERTPAASCAMVPIHGGGFAFYTAPSPDGVRGGTCYVNVADPSMWSRFSLEATVFHESIPGHHLQLALAQLIDTHPVLGELEVASFGEGWGLYAERLADEMGLYSDGLARLGMLALDSLRAARLVVDTGMHAMGWTRDEAIAFLADATPLAHSNVSREIDRYLADPGQATSYMIGRLEIDRLREHAHARLGNRFNLAGFHDCVLGGGMTPLPALGWTIEAWIKSVTATT